MSSLQEKIEEIELEIKNTAYNKATQHHIGKLKAKLSKIKLEGEKRSGASKTGYSVKKSGNATVALVGLPSVGKSTLLNILTNAESEVADYQFTTLDVVPGVMEYKGAKIQILDLPGLIKGASKGKGRGREILSVIRSADLIIIILDVFTLDIDILLHEINTSGLRLNQKKADIIIKKKSKDGLNINTTVELTKVDDELIRAILGEYYVNADIVIRDDITMDQLIDCLSQNIVYPKAFVVLNKIDLVNESYINEGMKRLKSWKVIPISADKKIGIEKIKEEIFGTLNFMRIFLRPKGGKADMEEPLVIISDSTVGMVCDILHRDFRRKFRYGFVWGKSAKFPSQMVGIEHVLEDQDILTIVTRK